MTICLFEKNRDILRGHRSVNRCSFNNYMAIMQKEAIFPFYDNPRL